jgi:two-component system, NarL family, sensor kinase
MRLIDQLGSLRYIRSLLVATAAFAIARLSDTILAAYKLHAEQTYVDDLLLACCVFILVSLLERAHAQQIERTRELAVQSETVNELSGQLLRLQDEERRRIARELHDSVGQLLAAVSMKIYSLMSPAHNLSQDTSNALTEIASLNGQISAEIRTLSHLLHPPLLDEVGLRSALRWYVDGYAKRSDIDVTLEIPDTLDRMAPEIETSVFRVVQEALTNIHRHSGSKTAAIRLFRENGRVQVQIEDNGKGISELEWTDFLASGRAGVGIRGMRERIRQLGGRLEISSNGHGTMVSASVPVETSKAVTAAHS